MNRLRSGLGIAMAAVMALLSTPAAEAQSALGLQSGQVSISRDEFGVPHVYGSTLEAVWFGVGYAQGQDRLWQAELLRRSAIGTSAEIFGSSALEGDVLARTLFGPPERRAALFDTASPEMKTILSAFVAGLNAWIR